MKTYPFKLFAALFFVVLIASSCAHVEQTAKTESASEERAGMSTYSGFGGGFGSSCRPGLSGGAPDTPLEMIEKDPSQGNVWVSVDFIELDKKDFRNLEKEIGFRFDATMGKVVLDATEKEELLDLLDLIPSAEFRGSATVLTLTNQTAQMQIVKENRYPTEFRISPDDGEEGESRKDSTEVFEQSFETRETGILITVTPTVSKDGKLICLVVFPESSSLLDWFTFAGVKQIQPIFASFNVSTTYILPNGSTVVLTGIPSTFEPKPLISDHMIEAAPKGARVKLMILSARFVPVDYGLAGE